MGADLNPTARGLGAEPALENQASARCLCRGPTDDKHITTRSWMLVLGHVGSTALPASDRNRTTRATADPRFCAPQPTRNTNATARLLIFRGLPRCHRDPSADHRISATHDETDVASTPADSGAARKGKHAAVPFRRGAGRQMHPPARALFARVARQQTNRP